MIRRQLPVFLSMLLLGPPMAAPGASAQNLSQDPPLAAGTDDAQSPAAKDPAAKDNDGRISVTRSDGSTGRTAPPDQKEIRRLVSYMRDGMNRADREDKQRGTKKVIQYRRIIKIRK